MMRTVLGVAPGCNTVNLNRTLKTKYDIYNTTPESLRSLILQSELKL